MSVESITSFKRDEMAEIYTQPDAVGLDEETVSDLETEKQPDSQKHLMLKSLRSRRAMPDLKKLSPASPYSDNNKPGTYKRIKNLIVDSE